jgi:Zn-dependent protease/predicted transcriptional regulator
MKGSMKLFKVFGIDIKLHFSWWLVFILIAWMLSASFFPQFFPGQTQVMYWTMGITASLLLFVSVLLHELSHSLVAKAKHIGVESITLFFFGGVAGITREDMKPSSEFQMAIAGPIFSFLLAGIFFLIYKFNGNILFVEAITFYLYQLNLILAIFNMIPAFPLDGGRALRAILHAYYKDLKKATHIAAAGGKFFAGVLVFLGIISLISRLANGLWFIFLGAFLYFIAGMSYEQVIIKEVLKDIKIKELIHKKVIKLSPKLPFSDFIKKYSNTEHETFLVMDKHFSGILDTKRIEKMPFKMQEMLKLQQVSLPFSQVRTLRSDDNAYTAFRSFMEQNLGILPVMDNGKFRGIVTRKSVLHRMVWGLKYGIPGKVSDKIALRIEKKISKKKKVKKKSSKKK